MDRKGVWSGGGVWIYCNISWQLLILLMMKQYKVTSALFFNKPRPKLMNWIVATVATAYVVKFHMGWEGNYKRWRTVSSNLFEDSLPAWRDWGNQESFQISIAFIQAEIRKQNLPNAVLGVTCMIHHALYALNNCRLFLTPWYSLVWKRDDCLTSQ